MQPPINLLVEGLTDEPVARRLIAHVGRTVGAVYPVGGTGKFKERLPQYNKAAERHPWFVMRDLDREACAVELRRRLLPKPASQMVFRIAVRMTEAWLLADAEAISTFFKVPVHRVPSDPEALLDPKAALVMLGMSSKERAIREGMTPVRGARVGREYTSLIAEFTRDHWRPTIAAARSDSLARCLRALEGWA